MLSADTSDAYAVKAMQNARAMQGEIDFAVVLDLVQATHGCRMRALTAERFIADLGLWHDYSAWVEEGQWDFNDPRMVGLRRKLRGE